MLLLAGSMLDAIDALTMKGQGMTARIGIVCGNTVVGTSGSLQPRLHIRGGGMEDAEGLEQRG